MLYHTFVNLLMDCSSLLVEKDGLAIVVDVAVRGRHQVEWSKTVSALKSVATHDAYALRHLRLSSAQY